MSKDKILVVEPDENIRNMLDIYFTKQGYEVTCVADNESGLSLIKNHLLPTLILLEVNMAEFYPDKSITRSKAHPSELNLDNLEKTRLSAFDFCHELRTTPTTSSIAFIFLTQPGKFVDRWRDIELGVDDYVTKPFDIEELKLRVRNAIQRERLRQHHNLISYRPTAPAISEHLQKIKSDASEWMYLHLTIQNFEAFSEIYGWQAADEVVRAMSLMLGDIVDDIGTQDDFIGHPQHDNFVVITHTDDTVTFKQSLINRFNTEIQQHYSFLDRERGYLKDGDERFPLMSLSITEIPLTYFGEQWDGTLPKQGN